MSQALFDRRRVRDLMTSTAQRPALGLERMTS